MLVSLIEEIKQTLRANNKTITDIVWIGAKDGSMAGNWNTFYRLGQGTYSNLWNFPQVPLDLVIVGVDWHIYLDYKDHKWQWLYSNSTLIKSESSMFLFFKLKKQTARTYLSQKEQNDEKNE